MNMDLVTTSITHENPIHQSWMEFFSLLIFFTGTVVELVTLAISTTVPVKKIIRLKSSIQDWLIGFSCVMLVVTRSIIM